MKKHSFLLFLPFLLLINIIYAQNLAPEMTYPDTLFGTQDSFYVNSPTFESVWGHPISKDDTLDLGTTGYQGVSMTIWTDLDTIHIPHVNHPYRQLVKIPLVSPTDTALCILRFQASSSDFSNEYSSNRQDEIAIEILEVYELANIILYLSNCSQLTGNRPDTEYSKRVSAYFDAFRDHQLIRLLNKNCDNGDFWDTYKGFRENSICFEFREDFLQYNTPYKQVFWDQSAVTGGHFRNLLYLIQDFAQVTDFRAFYAENLAYYNSLIDRQTELLPVKEMWSWLETEFPQRMDAYKIIFSPLIGGTHFTQGFQKGFFLQPEFQECIMFINSPERVDASNEEEELKKGLMSGIVFTEIDHNYVNPTSREHQAAVKALISDKDHWANARAQQNYSSESAIFNEYMTHALFCLYVKEHYPDDLSVSIIDHRIQLMERRGYPLFRAFQERLLEMMANRKASIYEAYTEIIKGMERLK